jgi:hypothetical protein
MTRSVHVAIIAAVKRTDDYETLMCVLLDSHAAIYQSVHIFV